MPNTVLGEHSAAGLWRAGLLHDERATDHITSPRRATKVQAYRPLKDLKSELFRL